MKKVFLIAFIFSSFLSYSQKDTIVQFLDRNGKIIKNASEANYYQTIIKRTDTLYKVSRYRKNGKLFAYWFTQSKNLKDKIGQSVLIDYNDSISSISYYNSLGKKHGKSTGWFDNRNKNFEGRFINGKKEGLWRYYHYNGKIAQQGFFKNDSVVKASYFDDKGNKMKKSLPCMEEIKFKGGMLNFYRKIRKLSSKVTRKIEGKIILTLLITTEGNVQFIDNFGYIPMELKDQVITHIEAIKGFFPKVLNNRKIPSLITLPINFQSR